MSEPTRVRVVVHGRVQGVFFRDTVRRAARDREWPAGCATGPTAPSRLCFEGERAACQAVVELSKEGPPGAAVERVDVSQESAEGLTGFEVA